VAVAAPLSPAAVELSPSDTIGDALTTGEAVTGGVGGLTTVASVSGAGVPFTAASGALVAPSQAARISNPIANACHSHHFIERLQN
jgi:hypothetical protein